MVWAMFVGELGDSALATLRPLVASGQLEFVGGGWVQPDEAITRFEDLADQLTLGHLFVQSVLGHAPVRVGWSADPFGHGSTMAYISALSAYDAHVLVSDGGEAGVRVLSLSTHTHSAAAPPFCPCFSLAVRCPHLLLLRRAAR